MRYVSKVISAVFLVEIIALIIVLYYVSVNLSEIEKRVEVFASSLFSFGALLVTTAIVYHHFWLHPELKILNIMVEPVNLSLGSMLSQNYSSPVFMRTSTDFESKPPLPVPAIENGFKKVRSTGAFPKIRVSTDVCNIGGSEISVHEYIIRELQPQNRIFGTFLFRRQLSNERRETLDFIYPDSSSPATIADGKYEFSIKVLASTHAETRKVIIVVSDNQSAISWKEYDC